MIQIAKYWVLYLSIPLLLLVSTNTNALTTDTIYTKLVDQENSQSLNPAVVTGIVGCITVFVNLLVGFLTIFFTAKNVDKQLSTTKHIATLQYNMQMLVAIEKDWSKNVTEHLSNVIHHARYLWQLGNKISDVNTDNYETSLNAMRTNYIQLTLLLNSNLPLEGALLRSVETLVRMLPDVAEEYTTVQFEKAIEQSVRFAHTLINERATQLVQNSKI